MVVAAVTLPCFCPRGPFMLYVYLQGVRDDKLSQTNTLIHSVLIDWGKGSFVPLSLRVGLCGSSSLLLLPGFLLQLFILGQVALLEFNAGRLAAEHFG